MSTSWSRSLPLSGESGHDGPIAVFDNREKAFEIKFAREEEMKFRATARRNKLVGLWAARKLGMGDPEAADYARTVVFADLNRVGGRDIASKLAADFADAGVPVTDDEIQAAMRDFMARAEFEVRTEA
ncbi:DUF1476 domain-containing protein [Pleomorphomonas diazotrophica]|uniref:DUF1476 domain-containing protein n=1 Tax=Pleomorphomonas diazotrophica TaxID=1166257 RepID=A0A1I4R4C8_9HYPH|nr:DUF1476 domain-containing protein [Pleomorphomonas diazotrophica]PKR90217.1 DUF1476 domain-containing protein [Pleomorphomonas diazotrophica]SFM46995.1 hypothetical protein SAMN05192571_101886 [Pleomorphomonas diazotrophica]